MAHEQLGLISVMPGVTPREDRETGLCYPTMVLRKLRCSFLLGVMLRHSISQTIVDGTHQVLEVKRFESRRHADLRARTGAELKKKKKSRKVGRARRRVTLDLR